RKDLAAVAEAVAGEAAAVVSLASSIKDHSSNQVRTSLRLTWAAKSTRRRLRLRQTLGSRRRCFWPLSKYPVSLWLCVIHQLALSNERTQRLRGTEKKGKMGNALAFVDRLASSRYIATHRA